MDELNQVKELAQAFGIELPTPAYLVGVLLFSVIGLVAFYAGRKRKRRVVMWLGVALMLYPYVVWGTVPMVVMGAVLSAATWWAWSRAGH
jgi:hypothetical protein